MYLTATNHTITAVLGAAVTTNELAVCCFYADNTTTTLTPGSQNQLTTGTTPVTIVSSPAASTQRLVKTIVVYNNDTTLVDITVRFFDGTNTRPLVRMVLQPGDTLEYVYTRGWQVTDSYGIQRQSTFINNPKPALIKSPGFNAVNASTTKTLTSTSTFGYYLGRADRSVTSINVTYRITTAAVTVTWAEVAIATGIPVLGGNPNLTTRGFTSTAGTWVSTGVKVTNVVTTGIAPGADLWVLFGNNSSTAAVVRAGIADDITAGYQVTATVRPSTMGAATAFTLEANTVAPIWWGAQFAA